MQNFSVGGGGGLEYIFGPVMWLTGLLLVTPIVRPFHG